MSLALLSSRYPISRLRGHRDQITVMQFIYAQNNLPSSSSADTAFLLTTGKDTFMKLWDLSTQHCLQTIVAHRSDVWSMALDPEQNLVFTGSGEGDLKAWRVDKEALAAGLKENESGKVRPSPLCMFTSQPDPR